MVVLDASVALSWIFPDEPEDRAEATLRTVLAQGASVPGIWALEVLNAILVGQRRKRLSVRDAEAGVRRLGELPVEIIPDNLAKNGMALLSLGRRFNLSIYDASYLGLAQRLSLPLLTNDDRLQSEAKKLSITLI